MKELYHDLKDYFYGDLKQVNIHIYNNGSNFDLSSFVPYLAIKHEQTETVINSFAFSIVSTTGGTAVYTLAPTALNSPGKYYYEIGIDYGSNNEAIETGYFNLLARLV